MATRYGRSPGGYVWAIAEPVAGIVIISFVFGMFVRVPPLGDNFILFFATGILTFQFYNTIGNNIARAIKFSRPLLFYPAVTWVDAVIARTVLTILTDTLVMLLLFLAFIAFSNTALIVDIVPVVLALGLAIAMGVGVGLINCVLFGFFPVWQSLWGITSRPMFFASGVLFVYEHMPATIQNILWYNPLIHIIGLMRAGFYTTYSASFASPLYVMCIAAPLIFFGLLLMGRYHRDLLNI